MRVIVADASAMVEYLLRTARARPIVMIVEGDDVDVQVPALCDVEVVAALRRALAAGRLDDSRAAEAVTDYCDLPITRHGHLSLLSRALQLRFNFSS